MEFKQRIENYQDACERVRILNPNYRIAMIIAEMIEHYAQEKYETYSFLCGSKYFQYQKMSDNERNKVRERNEVAENKLNWLNAIMEEYTTIDSKLANNYWMTLYYRFTSFKIPKEIKIELRKEYKEMINKIVNTQKEESKIRKGYINSFKEKEENDIQTL